MRISILVGVVCFFMLLQLLVFAWMVSDRNHTIDRYHVTEDVFVSAVHGAVSNFLVNLVPSNSRSMSGPSSHSIPSVLSVDDLSTWCNYRGLYSCRLDGVCYTVGDYCPYGLVVGIADGRIYCDSTNGVSIVRRRAVAPAPAGVTRALEYAPL